MSKSLKCSAADLIRKAVPGCSVTILIPNGIGRNGQEWKEKTGRAVICNFIRNPNDLTIALNMGGKFGTPGVATVNNVVRVGKYSLWSIDKETVN